MFQFVLLPVILPMGTVPCMRRYPENNQVTNPISGKMVEQRVGRLSTLIIFPGESLPEEKMAKGTIQIYNFTVLLSQKNHIQVPSCFDYNSVLLQAAYYYNQHEY